MAYRPPSDASPTKTRDTQFQGFAKALYEEVASQNPLDFSGKSTQAIIAHYAYDLVEHTLMHTIPASGSTIKQFQSLTIEEIAARIPDMTALPKKDIGA